MTEITTLDKLQCAERELKSRRFVYARWLKNGNMTPDKAEHEIACMQAIVDDYRMRLAQERALREEKEMQQSWIEKAL